MKHSYRKLIKIIIVLSCSMIIVSCDKDDSNLNKYEIVSIESDWFDVRYIEPRTYIIYEPKSSQQNVSYLILGDKKAFMFDTGSGENDDAIGSKISPILKQITAKPITLLLSHFHFDHNQNIAEFENVAFPEIPFLEAKISNDDFYHFSSTDLFLGDYPATTKVKELISVNESYSLGNRKVKLLNLPGHTNESIVILDEDNKLAFVGDLLYNGTLFLFDNKDISVYVASLNKLLEETSSSYRFFGAHGVPEMSYKKLQDFKTFFVAMLDKTQSYRTSVLWGFSVRIYEKDDISVLIFQ